VVSFHERKEIYFKSRKERRVLRNLTDSVEREESTGSLTQAPSGQGGQPSRAARAKMSGAELTQNAEKVHGTRKIADVEGARK